MNRLSQFFSGRYGMDQLSVALLICAFVLRFLTRLFPLQWISIAGTVFLLLGALRVLSRNVERRRAENEIFLNIWRPLKAWSGEMRVRWGDRKLYRYFRCPQCGQAVRVPKRKGKIRISCPQCGNAFVRKT